MSRITVTNTAGESYTFDMPEQTPEERHTELMSQPPIPGVIYKLCLSSHGPSYLKAVGVQANG